MQVNVPSDLQNKLSLRDAIARDMEWEEYEKSTQCIKNILETYHILNLCEMSREMPQVADIDEVRLWRYFDYFVSIDTSMIPNRNKELCKLVDDFGENKLLEYYLDVKRLLWLELIILLEDRLNNEMEQVIQKDKYIIDMKNAKNISKRDVQVCIDSRKKIFYDKKLLKYFTTSNHNIAIQNFIKQAVELWSFFAALHSTRSKSLQKTTKTQKDRLNLFLLIRRHLMFLPNDGVEVWGQIIEYGIQSSVMCILFDRGEHQAYKELMYSLNTLLELSIAPYRKEEWHWILDLNLVSILSMQISNRNNRKVGELFDQLVENMENSMASQLLTMEENLRIQIVKKQPAMKDGFYGDYIWRFNLIDMRIRNRIDVLVNEFQDYTAADRELKKLNHHKEFFRRKNNRFLCRYFVAENKLINSNNKEETDKLNLKLDKIFHSWNKMVLKDYPTDQIKAKIEILESLKENIYNA